MNIEKRKNFLINLAYFGVIAVAVLALARYILPLVTPFVLAFCIAYLLQGPIRFAHKKLHLPHKLAALAAVLLFYGAVGGLLTWAGLRAAAGITGFMNALPGFYETYAQPYFMEILQNLERVLAEMEPVLTDALDRGGMELIQSLGQLVSGVSVRAMSAATNLVSAVPGLFIKLVLMIISTFFITIDYDRLTGFCLRQMSQGAQEVFFKVKEYLIGTLFVCVRSYVLIMLLTFTELSIGLSLLQIDHAVLIALVIAVFDILPVLGTGGVMIPWTILTAIQGNYPLAIGLLAVYLIITVIRNIVEPKIVGGQLGLHPVVTLCSMFVGLQLMGAVGMFGFPILLSLLRYLNDHGVIRLFK